MPALCHLSKGPTQPSPPQQQVNKFSNPANRCIHCGGEHTPASCLMRYQPKATSNTSSYGSPKRSTRGSQSTQRSATPTLLVNNVTSGQVRGNQVHQVTPQVSPNVQQNLFAPPTQSHLLPPPPYFPIPFPPIPHPTFKCFYSSLSSSIGPVCSYIPDDKCCQPRKRKHDDHHRCVTEDHDTVCGRIAANYTDGSGCTSRRK